MKNNAIIPFIPRDIRRTAFLLIGCSILFSGTVLGQSHDQEAMQPYKMQPYKAPNGVQFEYVVLKPAHYNPKKSYHAVFAFPPNDMDRKAVSWSIENLWHAKEANNLLIIIPTIPKQSWHTHPSHHALEAFMDVMKKNFKVTGDKFHLVGTGTGAQAAITYANMSRKYFHSFTVTNPKPWDRWSDRDLERWCQQNSDLPVNIIVGELDEEGLAAVQRVETIFREGGIKLSKTIMAGENEELQGLRGDALLAEIGKNAGF